MWGPNSVRTERRHKFVTWVVDVNGTKKWIEMPGPRDADTWEECFRVFAATCVMLGIARPTVLEKYCQALRRRAREYPDQWHLVYRAEVRCRTEFWVEERRRQALWHMNHPAFSSIDPNFPFETVVKEATINKDFWDKELKEPALHERIDGRLRHKPLEDVAVPAAAADPTTRAAAAAAAAEADHSSGCQAERPEGAAQEEAEDVARVH